MFSEGKIWIGNSGEEKLYILPKMANRHGLITGATGTGKTVTLRTLAESFSDAGVPVFLADVKGDLAGISSKYPVNFFDVYGNKGIPLRTTVSEMGPLLLAKLMDLNNTQSELLTVMFKIADDQGLLLVDTKDLKAMLQYMGDNAKELSGEYGNIAVNSVTSIVRHVVALEAAGGDQFFAEPALNIKDFFANDISGKGMVNILDGRELVNDPTLYSAYLLWMLSELFEVLPEIGDPEKPRMVFFFDEAHLLFKDNSKALLSKLEQVIKLIRSKGVGIYFISQTPKDIPDSILAQLGNKIQHALRAYTPAEEKIIKTVADSFRRNPEFDTEEVLKSLGTGEALVSVLDEEGIPSIVKRTKILAPESGFDTISDDEKQKLVLANNLYLKYKDMEDRDSAYEFFQRSKKMEEAEVAQTVTEKMNNQDEMPAGGDVTDAKAQAMEALKKSGSGLDPSLKQMSKKTKEESALSKEMKSAAKKAASTAGGTIGRELGNSIGKNMGGTFGKKLGGNVGASLGRSLFGTFFK